MEQSHPDSTRPDNSNNGSAESLADYVKRKETEENLKKLAQKLEGDLKNPHGRDVSMPDVSTRDLPFEKFEEKRRKRDGQ